jgi:hypothetical protein
LIGTNLGALPTSEETVEILEDSESRDNRSPA